MCTNSTKAQCVVKLGLLVLVLVQYARIEPVILLQQLRASNSDEALNPGALARMSQLYHFEVCLMRAVFWFV